MYFWSFFQENFGKHADVRFGLDFSQGKVKGDTMPNSSDHKKVVLDTDMPSFDLCLLAACNHSIHTYGTFGAWGSLLAGGDVIAATGINPDANTEVGSRIKVNKTWLSWATLKFFLLI